MNPKVKNMIYCSMFACIIAILAQIKIDLPSLVPITLQTLGIYLISCYLKPKLAFISTVVYSWELLVCQYLLVLKVESGFF